MILYLIVRSTGDVVCYFGPFVTVDLVCLHEHVLLVRIPPTLFDLVIKVVVPPLTTLFPVALRPLNALGQLLRYDVPLLHAEFVDEHVNEEVLLRQPLFSLVILVLASVDVRVVGVL